MIAYRSVSKSLHYMAIPWKHEVEFFVGNVKIMFIFASFVHSGVPIKEEHICNTAIPTKWENSLWSVKFCMPFGRSQNKYCYANCRFFLPLSREMHNASKRQSRPFYTWYHGKDIIHYFKVSLNYKTTYNHRNKERFLNIMSSILVSWLLPRYLKIKSNKQVWWYVTK